MILLDKRVSDLVRGYDRISQADLRLQTEWRQHLLQNYASRRDKHTSAVSAYAEKAGVLKPQLSIIAFVPLAMLIGGLVIVVVGVLLDSYLGIGLTLSIGGLAVLIAGAIGVGLPTILWLWQVRLAKPSAPTHPLQEELLLRLTPHWRAKLHGTLPTTIFRRGEEGKQSFVKHLQALSLDLMYVLYDLQQSRNENVDVIVLGAKGIWVFVVKDWKGRVRWRDGEWFHERFEPRHRTWMRLEEQQPEQQWQRMASAVTKTLLLQASDLVKQVPAIKQIRGGVVFTYSKTIYEIPPTCTTCWGMIDAWDQEISSTPIIQGLDDRNIFRLLDALLERQHELNEERSTISMSAYATKIIRQTEARLHGWMKHE